jgi:hypothetical protein
MTPRLKTEIWVSAFLRQAMGEGRFGAVMRKGAPEAGAVYVIVNHLDGSFDLFGPAVGPSHDDLGERRWHREMAGPGSQDEVDRVLDRRKAADPDIWIIEIEDRTGFGGLKPLAD